MYTTRNTLFHPVTLFLSDDFGMSDVQAGSIYGAWGALITVFGLFTGSVIDNLGVAKCLRIGFALSLATRVIMLTCTSRGTLLLCLLVLLPLANCLGIPVLTVGIRRYTNDVNRGFAFGLFYVVMNVGALIAGPLVDVLTVYYNNRNDSNRFDSDSDVGDTRNEIRDRPISEEWKMTSNRAILLSGVVANIVAVFVAFSVREIKVDGANDVANKQRSSPRVTAKKINATANPTPDVSDEPETSVSEFQPLKGSSYQM